MEVIASAPIPVAGDRTGLGNSPSYFESFVEFAPAGPLYGSGFQILDRPLGRS
jgi:hypothetical protein